MISYFLDQIFSEKVKNNFLSQNRKSNNLVCRPNSKWSYTIYNVFRKHKVCKNMQELIGFMGCSIEQEKDLTTKQIEL
jgi:hypothetical protein